MSLVPNRSSEELRNEIRNVINRWGKEGHDLTACEVIGVLEMLQMELVLNQTEETPE